MSCPAIFLNLISLQPSPLFSKIEESTADALKKQFAGKQQTKSSKASSVSNKTTDSGVTAADKATLQAELDKQVQEQLY